MTELSISWADLQLCFLMFLSSIVQRWNFMFSIRFFLRILTAPGHKKGKSNSPKKLTGRPLARLRTACAVFSVIMRMPRLRPSCGDGSLVLLPLCCTKAQSNYSNRMFQDVPRCCHEFWPQVGSVIGGLIEVGVHEAKRLVAAGLFISENDVLRQLHLLCKLLGTLCGAYALG